MNTQKDYCSRVFPCLLSCVQMAAFAAGVPARDQERLFNKQAVSSEAAKAKFDGTKLSVEGKERLFLGEPPTITILIINSRRSPQTVKDAEYQKFSLEMTGIFQNDTGQYKKRIVYDGSWDLPKESVIRQTKPGETIVFENPRKRDPKFVKLESGESTNLTLDLSKTFGGYLGASKYRLTVISEDGQKVVKEFEVYFDDEKSVPVLAKMLASDSDDVTERQWSLYHLAKFSRPRLVTLLEELVRSGNEKQRDFASGVLGEIKAGKYGPDPSPSKIKPSGEGMRIRYIRMVES